MKKATPRRYKYNSEKNIRITNVSVAIPFSIDIMSESLLLENEHHNRIYGGSPLNPQYKGMIIFDLLQAIISIFSCLLSYIDIVSENMAAF